MASNYSKGGMCAMFYRAFYPNDMDATVRTSRRCARASPTHAPTSLS